MPKVLLVFFFFVVVVPWWSKPHEAVNKDEPSLSSSLRCFSLLFYRPPSLSNAWFYALLILPLSIGEIVSAIYANKYHARISRVCTSVARRHKKQGFTIIFKYITNLRVNWTTLDLVFKNNNKQTRLGTLVPVEATVVLRALPSPSQPPIEYPGSDF